MPLVKQNIPISFVKGLDLKSDRKQTVPGSFLALENAIFTTPGMLRKRNGYTALTNLVESGAPISTGLALATFNQELLEFDGSALYSYSQSNMIWIDKGPLTATEVSNFHVIRNQYKQTGGQMAQHASGLQLITWDDSRGGVRYSIVDSVTQQALVQDVALVSTSILAKPFALGVFLVIIYVDTANHHLKMVRIPVATPASPATPVDLSTTVNATHPNWDAALLNTTLYVSYNNSDGGGGVSTFSLNRFLVQSADTDIAGEVASACLSVCTDSTLNQIWVSYYNGTAVKYFVLNSALSLTPVSAPTIVETTANVVRIVASCLNGAGQFWYEVSSGTTYNTLVRTNTGTNAASVSTPSVFKRSVGLASKPFRYLSVVYLTLTFESPLQPTYFVVTSSGTIVAKAQTISGGGLLLTSHVAEAVQPTAGLVRITTLQKDFLTTISGTAYTQTGVSVTTFDFTSQNTFYKAQMASNLLLTGGILSAYDGVNVNELGFNVYPEGITNANVTTGGNLGSSTVATQYQYSVTYEWTDNQGQIHRSFPSIPNAATTVNFTSGVSTGKVTLTIPTLRLSQKSGVVITVYRTTGNGTIFLQLTNLGVVNQLLNDPTVDTITYIDTQSDVAIQGNPILYTTGNVVGNDAPPAPALIAQYINRLMLVPSENPLTIWFSEEAVPGTPLQFSELFTLNVDARGGAITALAQMDTYLIVFKSSLIFYQQGNGPDSTGAQNDFGNAQFVTTDSGCINARSIVSTPAGVLYQSAKGIYLLGRNLQVEYIGAPVEAYNSQTITSAILITTTNQVRFTLGDGATCLVYDYFMKQWSVFLNHDANDAVVFESNFTYVNPNGLVMQETPGLFTDNGNYIKLKAVTSWLSLASLQGFQRAYRALFVGEYISPHQLKISTAYDFNPTLAQQNTINPGNLFNLTTYGEDSPYGNETPYGSEYPLYEFRIDFERQQCTAIQFTIEDIQVSNYGEGLSISALNLTVGAKQGTNKLVPSKIYS